MNKEDPEMSEKKKALIDDMRLEDMAEHAKTRLASLSLHEYRQKWKKP